MKLIRPKFEIIEQEAGLDGICKQIELAGRTCYKSEDKITEGSAKKFVDMMIKSGHGAMLEHGTVYLKWNRYVDAQFTTESDFEEKYDLRNKYFSNKFSVCNTTYPKDDEMDTDYVTTNLRVLVENGWLDDLKYICEPTEFHEKRVTVKFTCDRVTGESFLRHRVFSFARESTRYCNYSKDKFGNELTFIIPNWCNEEELMKYGDNHVKDRCGSPESVFASCLNNAERAYFSLLEQGWKAQQARDILPFSIKSPLVMTGFVSDWEHFFELRCDSHAHPQAQELAVPLKEEFVKRGYIFLGYSIR